MEPRRYIFLRRRRVLGARLLGLAVSVILVGLPAELERGVAAEPEAGQEGAATWIAAIDAPASRPAPGGTVSSVPPHPRMVSLGTAATARPDPRRPYSDSVLRAFAISASQMIAIRERWRPVLERAAATGPEEAAEARRAQGIELAQAVTDRGITPKRYREIFNAARRDPALKSYLLSLVRTVDTTQSTD